MKNTPRSILDYIQAIVGAWRDDPRDDAQLLTQVVEAHDEGAFIALLWRHGRLVWRTCTRVLGDGPDAEDAFQTTFLALSRKASQLRADTLAGWLNRVARQTALNVEIKSRKRQSFEHHLQIETPLASDEHVSRAELYAALDEELPYLPEKLRVALILCYLEEKSQDDAARILGCSRTAVRKRLARGEAILRKRLERRGLAVGIGSLAALLCGSTTASAVPAGLIGRTARAAVAFRSGFLAGGAAEAAQAVLGVLPDPLADTILRKSFWIVLACCLALTGTVLVSCRALSGRPDEPDGATPAASPTLASPGAAARVDYYGDPLPRGALARLGTVRLRHIGWVRSVAFSPDGKTVASVGRTGEVSLWEIASGKEIRRLKGCPGHPSVVAFSPDGKTVVLGGQKKDGVVRLWDVASGKAIRTLKENQGRVEAVGFSSDGKIVASASSDASYSKGAIRLWEAASGKEVCTLPCPEAMVLSVAFSPDGKSLVSGGAGGVVRLWELASGKEIHTLKGHHGAVGSVAFSPDGQALASAGDDGVVRLWELASGKEIHTLKGHHGAVGSVAFSPDGQALASGGYDDGTVRLWGAATGKEIRNLKAAKKKNRSGYWLKVAFSPDGKVVAAGGWNQTVYLWETATGKTIRTSEGHEDWVRSVTFSPGGQFAASGGYDGTVRLWETATGNPVRSLEGHGGPVWSVAFSPYGQFLASGCMDDGAVHLWKTADGKEIRTLRGHKGTIWSVAYSPDGQVVVSAGDDGTVRLWEAASGKEIHNLRGHRGAVCSVAFSPAGRTVVSAGSDGTVRLWEAASGKEIRILKEHPGERGQVCSVAFSTDGKIVASRWGDGTIHLSEAVSGKEIRTLQVYSDRKYWGMGVAFSPDGGTLAAGSSNCIQLWDLRSGTSLPLLAGHLSGVHGVAFSPDGRFLVSVSTDTTGLVWDLNHGITRPTTKLAPDVLSVLWTDLASVDAAQAWRAVWTLAATPAQSVPLLRDCLRPMPAVSIRQLARLVADLDADDFQVRERAQREIEKLGPVAEPVLRKALEGKFSPEMQRRLEKLLEPAGGLNGRGGLSGEFLRGLRAVAVLEQVGTPEARQVLRTLAAGVPGFRLTQEAQAALSRLERVRRP